jgi:alpha-galactosidase
LLRWGTFGVTALQSLPRSQSATTTPVEIGNSAIRVRLSGTNGTAWSLTDIAGSKTHEFAPPAFPIDGRLRVGALTDVAASTPPKPLGNGVTEHRFHGAFAEDPTLSLEMVFRIAPESPVVRFRYELHSTTRAHRLQGPDSLLYLGFPLSGISCLREVQLSVFNEMVHSYTVNERLASERELQDGIPLLGPILVDEDLAQNTLLVAYEHGSEAPDAFLQFRPIGGQRMELRATKGNYIPGAAADGYSTLWMHVATSPGGIGRMRGHFRNFVHKWMSPNAESRKPYLFYNTWNYQERNKWWNGRSYLESMNPDRILSEIDVAHRLGIDVYVMDTGWYEATGDWNVSRKRLPGGLHAIRTRLEGYGMKLGLWFNPTAAAVSSSVAATHRACVRSWRNVEGKPKPIWETEASYPMCLVSPYSDAFADRLIRIARETGAHYFKWDAIGQYGCDSPRHWHGTEANSPEERADSYAFQLPLQMARIVEKISASIPEAIVDFDVTEAGRSFGLSFLSAGKYFLINNGPYAFNYDFPLDKEKQNWNLFFYPGPARTWICRSPLTYDRWLPSILFLTHYFPDDPASSQIVNVASLILGQNGIWGDLLKVSEAGIAGIAEVLQRYKEVRDDITASYPIQSGTPGASPEVHEKISEATGRGALVMFATAKGTFEYVTERRPARTVWITPGAKVSFDVSGHARIMATFDTPGAAIAFFS